MLGAAAVLFGGSLWQMSGLGADLIPVFSQGELRFGIELPEGLELQGEDMSTALRGTPQARTTPLHWEWRFHVHGHPINRSPILALRQGDWKLLANPDYERVELYHIPSDPMELNNLAERYPMIVTTLFAQALAWQATLPEGPFDETAGLNDYPWPGRD